MRHVGQVDMNWLPEKGSHKNWETHFLSALLWASSSRTNFIIHMCTISFCFSVFIENNKHEEEIEARIVGKSSRIVTHSVYAMKRRKKILLLRSKFLLCCYFIFSLYLNNTEIFCKRRREAQKRRSRRPRKRASNEDRMVKWKWMSFMFPSCVVVLRSCLPMRWDFFFSAFRLTSRMSLRRHY